MQPVWYYNDARMNPTSFWALCNISQAKKDRVTKLANYPLLVNMHSNPSPPPKKI